ncbi:MAG: mobilization protein [Oscillospiraceae bacterium]|jgi:ATP-dependent exoDNAse (exonuclease V) alpha subunit|nr:mobilization protein [Oscillospiraceae bacterium]
MALYSFHGQIIGRGKSIRMNQDGSVSEKAVSRRSTSVAAAAYRAGTRLVDERTGEAYDYTRKGGVVHTEIMLPANAPGRYHDRQTLWNAVELAERQNNSQLSRELRIALPSEFTRKENIALVRDFIQKNFVSKGMCADVAYHIKDKNGEDHNPHVHIMLTMRPMTKSGIWWKTKSRKEYITDRKGNCIIGANGEWKSRNIDLTGWNDKTLYVSWRSQWAAVCNEHYEAKGLLYRLDHRSYIEQGIHRQSTVHMGKEATALERKGVSTEKGNYNSTVARCCATGGALYSGKGRKRTAFVREEAAAAA